MRRVGDPLELLGGVVGPDSGGTDPVEAVVEPPLAFRWQGRRYVVASVLAHWIETGAWWRTFGAAGTAGASGVLTDPERQLWRVEVCRGASTGVFDLCHDSTGWSLRAVHD